MTTDPDLSALQKAIEDGRALVMVIDVQDYYLKKILMADRLLQWINTLLERISGKIPCMHIGKTHEKNAINVRPASLKRKYKIHPHQSDRWERLFGSSYRSEQFSYHFRHWHKIFVKERTDAFDDSRLEREINAQGFDTLIVTGLYEKACIAETVRTCS
ncbi:MAG: isochorismatase family protein [Alphaproteobacteria bacterium]|nr:isochorismatase family protein [Alphaproteobacteria bacterium]